MATEIISAIEGIGRAFEEFKKVNDEQLAALNKRIDEREQLEAEQNRPSAAVGRSEPTGFKRYETAFGPSFVVSSEQKLASIPGLNVDQDKKALGEPEVSLERWLAATAAGERCGDREAVQYARELKQISTNTSGVLIPAAYQPQWIDLLRAKSVLVRAGMSTVAMPFKTLSASAVTGDPGTTWHAEATSDISPSNPTFAARTLTAQTLVTRCTASVEVAQDSPDFGTQLAGVMTGAMAAELDRVGLEGSGTPPEPKGILNTSGRSNQTGTGALTSYGKIITGLGALLAANCDLEQISKYAIMSPGSWAAYQNLVTGISSDKTPLARPAAIENMEFLVTSNVAGSQTSSPQVPTTIYLGDFRDLLLGVRLDSSVEVLKISTFASSLILEFVGYLRADVVCTRPASFHTIEGVAA